MFDNETEQFFHLLRVNTIGDASSIGLRSILESNIPANVKTFFRADVEWLRAQEKAKEVRSQKFSYSLPELRLLDEQIDLLLVNNYQFSKKDFEATADKCIHFLLNYLCRPEWTLNSFFFDASVRITAEEMISKLRYCADYPYFKAILTRYTETRQRTDVGSEEMKRLLSTIDDEVCNDASPAELASIAKPIFDFVGEIRASMRPPLAARVPVRALIYFFEDKRLVKCAAALSAVREQDNSFQMTYPMLEMVLESVWRGSAVPDLTTLSAAAAVPDPMPVYTPRPETPIAETSQTTQIRFERQADAPIAAVHMEEPPMLGPNDLFDAAPAAEAETSIERDAAPEALHALEEQAQEEQVIKEPVSEEDLPFSDMHLPNLEMPSHGIAFADMSEREERTDAYASEPSLGMFAAHHDQAPDEEEQTEEQTEERTIVLPPQFTENDRLAITNALFQGSEALFDTAVDTAVHAENWDDAITALDSFFAEQNIDPFTKEAMMFTNILESWHATLKK